MHRWIALIAAGTFLFLSSPNKLAAEPVANSAGAREQTFQVKGIIKELKPDGKTVVIQHEAIPHYMEAMTMPFEARDTNELRGLQAGDVISFQMTVTDTNGWIHQISKLSAGKLPEPPARAHVFITRDIEPLNIGDTLPDYHFTNELGKAVSISEFRGQPLVFTFFFTSCPFPQFCPLLSSHFEETQKKLLGMTNAPPKWHLLSISFDPGVDTPEVLKHYAERFQYDPRHWSFVTGEMVDLISIGDEVGEEFSRSPETGVSHNLRTVVVDAQGRIQKIYHNNDWTADELVAEILKAAQAKP